MIIAFLVAFLASIAGAICGIGGGVIIKPVLDLFRIDTVSTVSFLSGCTVLSMSCYSVGKSMLSNDKAVDIKTGTPLAVGAAAGGLAGNQMFAAVKAAFENPNAVGAVQAACLAVITLGTLLFTIYKARIPSRNVKNAALCVLIGFVLGVFSSFLGIGGGPINLVVLSYFFGMTTKVAAANSLYIILFSQTANLITTLVSRKVPEFSIMMLVLMVLGGISGGILGRILNRRMNNRAVEILFIILMIIIIMISIFNCWKFSCLA